MTRVWIWTAPWLGAAGGGALWRGFVSNQEVVFFAGLLALVLALILGGLGAQRARVRWLPELSLALVASLLTFAVLELGWALRDAVRPGDSIFGADFYTYDQAQADRSGFERWWGLHLRRWAQLDPRLVMATPSSRNPYVLIPGAIVPKGGATLRINRLGFRGPEIELPKGARFRMVALGESTTFGITVTASDRTWPEVLEAKIAAELLCDLPVEVVNGGVPGWTLANQLERLRDDVLPLEPDLLISYHGFNGFLFFLREVDGLVFASHSALKSRPSRILEAIERGVRSRATRARQPDVKGELTRIDDEALSRTAYARLYRELLQLAGERGIGVALATFSMAVDQDSPEEVIRFYEGPYPDVRSRIVSNQLHSRILRAVAAQDDDAVMIDTSPGLAGAYQDLYVDLVHFTQEGRDRLAANLLEGLWPVLRDHASLRCRRQPSGPIPTGS